MKLKSLIGTLAVAGLLASAAWAAPKAAKRAESALAPGNYQAKVKAIVCSGCGGLVEEALKANTNLEGVSVDQDKSEVKFSVKKGSKLKLSELQSQLKTTSGKMGMGADYQLKDLKKI